MRSPCTALTGPRHGFGGRSRLSAIAPHPDGMATHQSSHRNLIGDRREADNQAIMAMRQVGERGESIHSLKYVEPGLPVWLILAEG